MGKIEDFIAASGNRVLTDEDLDKREKIRLRLSEEKKKVFK